MMITRGKSISHGAATLEYDLAKRANGEAVVTRIHHHELFGCADEEVMQEMKPHFVDSPNVKNSCLRLEVSPLVGESVGMIDTGWAKLGNGFMRHVGLMNRQYVIVEYSGTGKDSKQTHLHMLANRMSLSGEFYKDNWIGKRAIEAANSITREWGLVQSKDTGEANRGEVKQAIDSALTRMQGLDPVGFSRKLGKLGSRVREIHVSTGKLDGYYVKVRSGTEYKTNEIGKDYTLTHIGKTWEELKYNLISGNHGGILRPKDEGLHL